MISSLAPSSNEMKYERKDLKPLKIEQMYVIVCYTYLAIRRRADGCQEFTCTSPDDERKRTVAIRGARALSLHR
jgi:hypothetical protein